MRNILEEINNNEFRLSQSRMKKLLGRIRDPRKFLDSSFTDSDSTILGRAVECLTLEGTTIFNNKFRISDFRRREDTKVQQVINNIVDSFESPGDAIPLDRLEASIIASAIEVGYGLNWNRYTIISKVREQEEYYREIVQEILDERTVISNEDYELATQMSANLLTNPLTSRWISPPGEIQLELEGEIKDVQCMGILDYFYSQANTGIIVDLKTTSLNPLTAAYKSRWDLQGAFYHSLVEQNYPELDKVEVYFIVSLTYNPTNPIVFKMSDEELVLAKNGKKYQDSLGRTITHEGIYNLIDKFKYYRNNSFEGPYYGSNEDGVIGLNLFT